VAGWNAGTQRANSERHQNLNGAKPVPAGVALATHRRSPTRALGVARPKLLGNREACSRHRICVKAARHHHTFVTFPDRGGSEFRPGVRPAPGRVPPPITGGEATLLGTVGAADGRRSRPCRLRVPGSRAWTARRGWGCRRPPASSGTCNTPPRQPRRSPCISWLFASPVGGQRYDMQSVTVVLAES
jgi:hypothetical protein